MDGRNLSLRSFFYSPHLSFFRDSFHCFYHPRCSHSSASVLPFLCLGSASHPPRHLRHSSSVPRSWWFSAIGSLASPVLLLGAPHETVGLATSCQFRSLSGVPPRYSSVPLSRCSSLVPSPRCSSSLLRTNPSILR